MTTTVNSIILLKNDMALLCLKVPLNLNTSQPNIVLFYATNMRQQTTVLNRRLLTFGLLTQLAILFLVIK